MPNDGAAMAKGDPLRITPRPKTTRSNVDRNPISLEYTHSVTLRPADRRARYSPLVAVACVEQSTLDLIKSSSSRDKASQPRINHRVVG